METISCNVVHDILPIYIDGTASSDTRELVEEHLKKCESCRRLCSEIQREFQAPAVFEDEGGKETQDLKNFKRFLRRKRLHTALTSALVVLVFLLGGTIFMNSCVLDIAYEDAGITIDQEDAESVYYSTGIRGNYHWMTQVDRETGINRISFEQSLWERYVECLFHPFDHIHLILKKDEIKRIYADADGTEHVIWEASDEEKEAYFSGSREEGLG
ncbi:MAG: zf-HC2 domain-containing protein [Eubacteriales bacterium]|nr:zf-HC2 domain-containing protein [Eubacteriales bacterium]